MYLSSEFAHVSVYLDQYCQEEKIEGGWRMTTMKMEASIYCQYDTCEVFLTQR